MRKGKIKIINQQMRRVSTTKSRAAQREKRERERLGRGNPRREEWRFWGWLLSLYRV